MHAALTRQTHRPWPVPKAAWRWRQTWHHLLFAHWPIDAAVLRPLVPSWLKIEEFGGSSWVGLVPFAMSGVTLRGVPPLPWLSQFPEMNLRLYVERDGKPGIWFISLDASRAPAVWAARTFVHLPYYLADMSISASDDGVRYRSSRLGPTRVELAGRYRPTGQVRESRNGSIEHFLTERYCLYTEDAQRNPRRLEIHHHPWPLQPADAEFEINDVAPPQGIDLPDTPPLLHFSRRLDVIGWGLERIQT
jgi:uncharacterized protein